LIISAPNKELSRQYSQTFLDLLRTCSLLWGSYPGVTGSHGEGEKQVAKELSNIAQEYKTPILDLVSKSILSLQPPLVIREPKPSNQTLSTDTYSEPLGLVWEIVDGILETIQQVLRIQGVYPTRRKISDLNLNSRRLRRVKLSDSDSEED